jgi:cobalt-precorrin 5A hydrolase
MKGDFENIRIVALTEQGQCLAEQITKKIPGSEVWFKPKPFSEKIQTAFSAGNPLILICAMGIAVRTLAPVINNKHEDPPVLVLDEQGKFVVPLLSGHEGGANEWGRQVAELLQAQWVVTTAKHYTKPIYTVGMGCERHCPKDELHRLLMQCLKQANLSLDDIDSINSIAIKADEQGLIELAKELNKPYQTFSAKKLSEVEPLLSTKSDYVFETVGVYGVAESAALVAAANTAEPELVLLKQKTSKATCAIARSYSE